MNSQFAHFVLMARAAAWSSLATLLYWIAIANIQDNLLALQAHNIIETIIISPILVVGVTLLLAICVLIHRHLTRILARNMSYVIVGLLSMAVLVILIIYFPIEYPLLSHPSIISIIITFILPTLTVLAANFNWVRNSFRSPAVTQGAPKHHAPRRSEADIEELLSKVSTEPHGNVRLAVSAIRLRAHSMMHRATGILYVIVAVLIVTALFIAFAGKIAEIGINRFDPLAELNAERVDVHGKLVRLRAEQAQIEHRRKMLSVQLAQTQTELGEYDSENQGAINFTKIRIAEIEGDLSSLEIRKSQIPEEIKTMETRLASLHLRIDQARSSVLNAMIGKGTDRNKGGLESITDTELLVAASLTRVGVLVVAIYLVQILVQLYRYNTRISANYFAHADALLLRKHLRAKEHKSLQDSLHPDVPYGGEPKPFWQRRAGRDGGIFGRRKSDQRSQNQDDSEV